MPKPRSRIVLASHNKGKLKEIAQMLSPLGIDAVSAAELNLPEPEETGLTFAENAALKARAAAQACGEWSLADDSGLCVEALDNAPGIYSARWTGPEKNYAAAFARIQRELTGRHAAPPYRAHFACVLCLASPNGEMQLFEGRVDGELVFPPRGAQGFGYDPIFTPQGDTRTFGEFPAEEKNGISHRARAFRKFQDYLYHWKP